MPKPPKASKSQKSPKQSKQSKQPNLDRTLKKVEGISNKVNAIMRNRLIIAILLIVDGVTFLLNPDTTLPEMAKNIILLVLLAAASVLVANLAIKPRDRKTIAITILILLAGIFFYFYPDLISAYIQLLLALFIIYQGLTNIANTLHLNKLSRYTQAVADKLAKSKATDKEKQAQNQKFKEVDSSINQGLEEQKNKLVSPLKNIIDKSSKFSKLYIVANVASVILGIILLIFPGASMAIWGVIFLYTGISNFLAAIKK